MGEDGDKVKLGEVVELLQDPIFFWSKKPHHGLDAGGKYRFTQLPPWKLTWLAGQSTMNEDVFPIEHGDFPMSLLVFRVVIILVVTGMLGGG